MPYLKHAHWFIAAFVIAIELTPASAQNFIDNIIVTTRRSQSAQFTNPGNIHISIPSDADLIYPADMMNRVPGVYIQRGSGQEHLTALRSPILTAGAGAGSFLYLEDNVPLRAAGFANVNALMDVILSDAARVETVRGPSSALYGSNAQHGMINVIAPEPEESSSYLSIQAGSYGRYHLTTATTLRQTNHASRLSISLSGEEEGARANAGFGQQKFRWQTKWGAGDKTARLSLAGMNLNQETAGYASDFRDQTLAKANDDDNAHRDAWSLRAALKLEKTNGDSRISLTPYWRKNKMTFRMHFLSTADPLEKNAHESLGILSAYERTSPAGHLVIIGLDIDYTQGSMWQFQTNPARFGYLPGLQYDYQVTATSLAPYAHAEWMLAPQTKLTTGLRAELTQYRYDNNTSNGGFGRFLRPADREDDFDTLSPKLGLTHQIGQHLVFVNLSRGSRAPQTTDMYRLRMGQNIGDIRPEKLDSVEIGWRLQHQNFALETTAYHMKKKNYYFRDSNSENLSNGKTSHAGLEVDLSAHYQRLSGAIRASYARHLYEFTHAPNQIMSGQDIDSAPRKIMQAELGYDITSELATKLHWHYIGPYHMNESGSQKYDGHSLVDFNLFWRAQENYEMRFAINNLFDKAYARRADFAFGQARYFPGERRHWSFYIKRYF